MTAHGEARKGERVYWLDSRANVDKLVRYFYAACAGLLAIDVFVAKHGPFGIEHAWGFYGNNRGSVRLTVTRTR